MIIDAHVYCLPLKLRNPAAKLPRAENAIAEALHHHPEGEYALSLSSPEAILASMNKSGIDISVLVSLPWTTQEFCQENNEFILNTVKNEKRFMGICSVQPSSKSWEKEVNRCLAGGAIGIKVNPAWQGYYLDGPEMNALADFATEKKAFLMVHIDHPFKKSPASPAHLLNLARKHPQTRILATHLGGLLGIYATHPPVAESLKNIWFDTAVSSTLQMVRFYVETGLSDKIVFASDFPFNHSHSQKQVLNGIRELNLKPEAKGALLSKNFLTLINFAKNR